MRLYETLRTFSRYACAVDPQSRLLPKGPGGCHGRTDPYIYSDAEAASMMSELASLHSPDGLRARSLPTMFWIGYIFLDDFGRTKPAFLNSTGVMYPSVECILKLLYQCT